VGRRRLVGSAVAALLAWLLLAVVALPAFGQAGSLDASFSSDGKATADFSRRGDFAGAVAIQADGKIVVAGGSAWDGSNPKFALARYNTNGTLDASFGGDGRVTTDFTTRLDAAWGVAIQADGKIVAAGDAGLDSSNSRFAVARYNPNGTLDTTFSGDGKVTTQFTRRDDDVAGLAIQADGKILVSGGANSSGSNPRSAIARYNTNGKLDTSFGGDGKVTTDLTAGNDFFNTVVVQADGKILAAGLGTPSGSRARFALARYNEDGTLDTSFSTDGKVLTNFTRWQDSVQNLALQADGKIVAAGIAGAGGSNARFALARYNPGGTLDTSFSGDGKLTTDFTSKYDAAYDVVLQADGKIVAAGEAPGSGGRFALARYDTDGALDTTFSGDGKITTNFTPRGDFAYGVAIQGDGKIVLAGGSGWGGSNPRLAVARYVAA
jgi:uncharacterized delta-60 repeat protein